MRQEAREILRNYEGELQALSGSLDEELLPLRDRLEVLRLAIIEAGNNLEVCLPDRPDPEILPTDESAWLYCSERDYLEQMRVYKARKNGGIELGIAA